MIALTAEHFDHQVISINRQGPGLTSMPATLGAALGLCQPEIRSQKFAHGVTLEYFAPGKGILHKRFLQGLGKWLAEWIRMNGRPDLIVANKLTIEGVAVHWAARELDIPYAITLQGNTDLKILTARPDLRCQYSRIWQNCSAAFAFAPWTLRAIEDRLGKPGGSPVIIPCPLGHEFAPMPPKPGGKQLLSAFHLDNYRDKNFIGLANAMQSLNVKLPDIQLAIAGTGSEPAMRACQAFANAKLGVIQFLGHLQAAELRQRMNDSVAFVLPSKRESFGLVFIEALFSGLPIIYPAGAAVDGLLDGHKFAVQADAQSHQSIADAMEHCVRHEQELKLELADWLHSEDALRFTREVIARDFTMGLRAGLVNPTRIQSGTVKG